MTKMAKEYISKINFYLAILFLIILIASFVSSQNQHQTKAYTCLDGNKKYDGLYNPYSNRWCPNPNDNNYIRTGLDGSTGVCFSLSNEPLECNKKRVFCYEPIEGVCQYVPVFGECGYRQFASLDDCRNFISYYQESEEKPKNNLVNYSILLAFLSIIILVVLVIILIKLIRKKK
ncbi:MAG TPA: hypothetical protein VJB89_01240 [Candidatus Nanoarchaeia archaeon]|nr:hypothetical protein [Candidatus Nanoarchaeia archaeon]